MPNDQLAEAVEKLKYQISILGNTIDSDKHPIEALVMGMNWGHDELEKAHDIFERWEKRLDEGKQINKHEFEADFSNELGISYQDLKFIVLAFYKNGQWTSVCEGYVDSFGDAPSIEYHSIMRRER